MSATGIPSEFLFQQPDARCKDGQCLDDVLLDGLARALTSKTDGDRIIVIHQLGSHGPEYFKRSAGSDKVFAPECQDKQLQLCDRAEIINAYDNSIVATDRLLATIIAQLQQQEDYNCRHAVYVRSRRVPGGKWRVSTTGCLILWHLRNKPTFR